MMDASEVLRDTQLAFDSVAEDYDGTLGNNALVQRIRARTLDAVMHKIPPGCKLLDLGCGTGLDAAYLAQAGYFVTAIDWSAEMVRRTKERIANAHLQNKAEVNHLGFHQLDEFQSGAFDGVYSNLGALNCAIRIEDVAVSLSKILKAEGKLIVSVIGRICPWEWIYYSLKAQWRRANLRFQRGLVPVPLNGRTVWTRYYLPHEFQKVFENAGFQLVSVRALGLFVPPPYMIRFAESHTSMMEMLQGLDDRIGHWPILRNGGDHFLIVMQKYGRV
ncbi:MAG TPA: methyltransferase domain-containing protein [Anaerolineales bacterium]|nr:methyltransferase domain-containing protein [Anaerolineales bacterium]